MRKPNIIVLNLSEAARCLGIAQEKGDQDAIDHWGAMVARFERVLIQSAEQQPRSDALIVEQTERIAAILAEAFFGSELPPGANFRDSENLKAQACWRVAADIQEELTGTDVENALAELEDEQQPAPDVAALVEALEEGLRAIGDHHAPGDCYATGPMTGDSFRDLVQCPACSFITMCDDLLAAYRNQGVQL